MNIGEIYTLTGFIIVNALLIIGVLSIFDWIMEKITNWLANKWKFLWQLFEFVYYRKEFREWVKDKDRHPKAL